MFCRARAAGPQPLVVPKARAVLEKVLHRTQRRQCVGQTIVVPHSTSYPACRCTSAWTRAPVWAAAPAVLELLSTELLLHACMPPDSNAARAASSHPVGLGWLLGAGGGERGAAGACLSPGCSNQFQCFFDDFSTIATEPVGTKFLKKLGLEATRVAHLPLQPGSDRSLMLGR